MSFTKVRFLVVSGLTAMVIAGCGAAATQPNGSGASGGITVSNTGGSSGSTSTTASTTGGVPTVLDPPTYLGYYFLANTTAELAYTSYPAYISYPQNASYPTALVSAAAADLTTRATEVCQFLNFTSLGSATSSPISTTTVLDSVNTQDTLTYAPYLTINGVTPTYIKDLTCIK